MHAIFWRFVCITVRITHIADATAHNHLRKLLVRHCADTFCIGHNSSSVLNSLNLPIQFEIDTLCQFVIVNPVQCAELFNHNQNVCHFVNQIVLPVNLSLIRSARQHILQFGQFADCLCFLILSAVPLSDLAASAFLPSCHFFILLLFRILMPDSM
jgi:hypothetical protein